MKLIHACMATTALIAVIFIEQAYAEDKYDAAKAGYELAVRMDEIDNSIDSVAVGKMVITRGDKKLFRNYNLYTKWMDEKKLEERVLFVFDSPADVKGTTYLEWTYVGLEKEDDLWVYLPSESLVRRISGAGKQSSFMRSDLTNEDLENMDDIDAYTYELLNDETFNGIECHVLVRYPKPEKNTQYSKQVQWVRKDNLLRAKMDMYDKKNKLIKTIYFDACEKIDNIWTNTKTRVVTADGRSTTLIDWTNIKYNVGLKDEMFEHSQLHR